MIQFFSIFFLLFSLLPIATLAYGQSWNRSTTAAFQSEGQSPHLHEDKVDAERGYSRHQSLQDAQIPTMPTDTPGQVGTAIPNTIWVDTYYLPKNWFITGNETRTVCASGCNYSRLLDAWHAALSSNFLNDAVLTIRISDGVYNVEDQFFTNTQKTKNVKIMGNIEHPEKVVLNFTHIRGTNLSGFAAYNGGQIGLIDGVTIQAPSDGSGSLAYTDSSGRHIWNPQSYGAGIQAYGAGSNISLGNHVIIRNFYYSLVADNNGGIDAPNGGIRMSVAGDANVMARGGGVIVCLRCSATDVSDYTDPLNTLGSNYDAERGGSLYIDGSSGSKSLVNGIVGLTGGHIWAHHVILAGGLNSGGNGVGAWENSSIELTEAAIRGYMTGIDARQGAFVDADNVAVSNNKADGMRIDGGRVDGSHVISKDNGGYGVNVLHQGIGHLYATRINLTGNAAGIAAVEAAGKIHGYEYQGASLILE